MIKLNPIYSTCNIFVSGFLSSMLIMRVLFLLLVMASLDIPSPGVSRLRLGRHAPAVCAGLAGYLARLTTATRRPCQNQLADHVHPVLLQTQNLSECVMFVLVPGAQANTTPAVKRLRGRMWRSWSEQQVLKAKRE